MGEKGPSLPSNYVTILDLKQRWLQQQQQKEQEQSVQSSNHHGESSSQSSRKPEDDSASEVPNEAVVSRRNRHREIYRVPEVRLRDSGSKAVVHVVDEHLTVEKQDRNTDQSNSRLSSTKNSSAGRNPRFVNEQNQTQGSSVQLLETEPVQEKIQTRYKGGRRNRKRNQNAEELSHNDSDGGGVVEAVKETTVSCASKAADDHPMVEKQVRNTDQSNSRLSKTKNSSAGQNPRFVNNQNQTGGSSVPVSETEPVQEKKRTLYVGGRWDWKRNQNADELAHNDSGGVDVVEAVNEISVSSKIKVADDHPMGEKQVRNIDQHNSRFLKSIYSSVGQNPRVVNNQNQTGGSSAPLLDAEPVQEKKQTPYVGGRRYWKRNQNADELLHNDPGGDDIIEAVKEITVSGASKVADDSPVVEKQERYTVQSNSRLSKKKSSSAGRNPRFMNNQNQTGGGSVPLLDTEPVQEKKQTPYVGGQRNWKSYPNADELPHNDCGVDDVVDAVKEMTVSSASKVVDDHSMVEKLDRNTDQSNSRLSKRKNISAGRSARFMNNQNHSGGSSVPLLDTEPLQEKKQTHYVDGRWYWKRKQNTDGLAHNDSGGDDVVEAANEISVSARKGSNRRSGSGRFNEVQTNRPLKPPIGKTPPASQNVNGSSLNSSGGDDDVEAVKEISVCSASNRNNRRSGSGRFKDVQTNRPLKPPVGKTPPVAQNLNGSSHNDSGDDDAVEAVKEIRVSARNGSNRRSDSGRFNDVQTNKHSKPPVGKTPPVAQNVNGSSLKDSGGDDVVEAVKEISVSSESNESSRRSGSGRFNGASEPVVVKTPPAQKINGSSHSETGSDVVEAVVAAVKEINVSGVSQGTDRRWRSKRIHGNGPSKPSFGVKKAQMATVWVRKGESAPI